jgi:Carboxypeptidase regulatory-like domain
MKRNGEILRRDAIILGLALLVCVFTGLAQKSKKGDDQANRSVQGTVTSAEDAPVAGAVVQLKNTKTLQIRSFIAKEDGSYYFNGLSPDVDYELRAEYQGSSSPTKTMSSFDSRKAVTINLKLNKK